MDKRKKNIFILENVFDLCDLWASHCLRFCRFFCPIASCLWDFSPPTWALIIHQELRRRVPTTTLWPRPFPSIRPFIPGQSFECNARTCTSEPGSFLQWIFMAHPPSTTFLLLFLPPSRPDNLDFINMYFQGLSEKGASKGTSSRIPFVLSQAAAAAATTTA